MLKKLVLFAVTVGLVSVSAVSLAQDEAVIKYRQKVMDANGANLGAISDILKFSLPYQQNIKAHAEQLASAASLIPSAFKKDVSEGLTDAKPEIWKNWDEFEQYANDLKTASDALAEAAGEGDMAAIGEKVQGVGHACKQCHEDFRKPKEDSYRNKK
jgi:cytochrome c556